MTFDYVIAGAGSAGCALAARLSEDPTVSVCLLEAGGSDDSVLIRAPAGIAVTLPTRLHNWAFKTLPQAGLAGRRGYQPRGRTLGGSSSINAMLYVRGHPSDYDRWAALGNRGWSYAEVLPYFKRSENNTAFGETPYHGAGGPLGVSHLRSPRPINEAFLAAAAANGVPNIADCNAGPDQFGSFMYQVTQLGGERCSAARAYLAPNGARANLRVLTGVHCARVLLDGHRADGIAYYVHGELREVLARREVILSAGAFGSPQLLMLSGIGAPEELRRHGIAVAHALPGVGKNLQDHIDYIQAYRARRGAASDTFGLSFGCALQLARAVPEWRRHRTGLFTSPFAESGAFLRSAPGVEVPDLQLIFVVGIADDHNRKLHLGHGFSCHVTVLRPKSRGTVALRSREPRDSLLIDPRFLEDEADLRLLMRGARLQRAILEAKPFDRYRGEMLYPVPKDDERALEQDLRRRADTQYHPVGTCKMGPQGDPMAVVDERLRVRGVAALRVADASIMPTLIGGNTNAPSIMIGEKAADLIRAQR
ncbi:MAG TPA: GMC family oxidoreductase N-terminal domain-containing protein [Burkholderiales bacterium]|jgi:choline dehydrogenase|nr:GMC family oxidoreductase N-terminal domain-containing protein [Burkholderiales bacterium]